MSAQRRWFRPVIPCMVIGFAHGYFPGIWGASIEDAQWGALIAAIGLIFGLVLETFPNDSREGVGLRVEDLHAPPRPRFSVAWALTATACVAVNLIPYTHGDIVLGYILSVRGPMPIADAALHTIAIMGPPLSLIILCQLTWWKVVAWWGCFVVLLNLITPVVQY